MKLISILALVSTTCLSMGLLLSLYSGPAYAFTPYEIMDVNGNKAFELRLFNPDDGEFIEGEVSTWVFDPLTIGRTKSAGQYWADNIKVTPGQNPAIMNVGAEDDDNAAATSPIARELTGQSTELKHDDYNSVLIDANSE